MTLDAPAGFPYYVSLVGQADFRGLFRSQSNLDLLASITPGRAEYRYAPGKWSLKQIVGHMTDHERIMTYGALRFSRKDSTPLAGYEQEMLIENSRFNEFNYADILQDFRTVRQATTSFMSCLSSEQLLLKGKAWKFVLSVEDVLKATIEHELHHMAVIRERYLK